MPPNNQAPVGGFAGKAIDRRIFSTVAASSRNDYV
jgi:hypothetical protein